MSDRQLPIVGLLSETSGALAKNRSETGLGCDLFFLFFFFFRFQTPRPPSQGPDDDDDVTEQPSRLEMEIDCPPPACCDVWELLSRRTPRLGRAWWWLYRPVSHHEMIDDDGSTWDGAVFAGTAPW